MMVMCVCVGGVACDGDVFVLRGGACDGDVCVC